MEAGATKTIEEAEAILSCASSAKDGRPQPPPLARSGYHRPSRPAAPLRSAEAATIARAPDRADRVREMGGQGVGAVPGAVAGSQGQGAAQGLQGAQGQGAAQVQPKALQGAVAGSQGQGAAQGLRDAIAGSQGRGAVQGLHRFARSRCSRRSPRCHCRFARSRCSPRFPSRGTCESRPDPIRFRPEPVGVGPDPLSLDPNPASPAFKAALQAMQMPQSAVCPWLCWSARPWKKRVPVGGNLLRIW